MRGRRGPPENFGRFPALVSDDELAEFFFLDDQDRRLIARRRRDSNRLGFAVQLGTVRYLGRFVEDLSEGSYVKAPPCEMVARSHRSPSRVAGAVARPGSHRTVRTLVVYGSSGRRVMTPAAGRFIDLESFP